MNVQRLALNDRAFGWTYDQADPALMLFTAAVERFGLTFPSRSLILELGCAETDWLERMHRLDPTYELIGVDARHQQRDPTGFTLLQDDACRPDLFMPQTFDRIVLLGALEHFGLGFYGDPIHEYKDACVGDVLAMLNVARWLKPGGEVYFDVPCNPVGSIQPNRHFRIYSPAEIGDRLLKPGRLRELARGYSDCEPRAGQWCDAPTESKVPYHYCAVWARKIA